jgi:hypothetical protein
MFVPFHLVILILALSPKERILNIIEAFCIKLINCGIINNVENSNNLNNQLKGNNSVNCIHEKFIIIWTSDCN